MVERQEVTRGAPVGPQRDRFEQAYPSVGLILPHWGSA